MKEESCPHCLYFDIWILTHRNNQIIKHQLELVSTSQWSQEACVWCSSLRRTKQFGEKQK